MNVCGIFVRVTALMSGIGRLVRTGRHPMRFGTADLHRYAICEDSEYCAFSKVHTQVGPLQARAERCIFLGYSTANSAYLCGTWRKHDAVKRNGGYRFVLIESR